MKLFSKHWANYQMIINTNHINENLTSVLQSGAYMGF